MNVDDWHKLANERSEEIRRLMDLLHRARRLLSVCSFDAPEDLADLEAINEERKS